jgi:hypothetical protein
MQLSYRTVAMLATGRFEPVTEQRQYDRAAQRALDWAESCEERPGVHCTYSVHRDVVRGEVLLQVAAALPAGDGDPDLRYTWRTFR